MRYIGKVVTYREAMAMSQRLMFDGHLFLEYHNIMHWYIPGSFVMS